MNIRLGVNKEVISGFRTIGLAAFVTVIFSLSESVIFIFLARKLMGINKTGERVND